MWVASGFLCLALYIVWHGELPLAATLTRITKHSPCWRCILHLFPSCAALQIIRLFLLSERPNEVSGDSAERELIRNVGTNSLNGTRQREGFLPPILMPDQGEEHQMSPFLAPHIGVRQELLLAFGVPAQAAGAEAEAMLNTF